MTRGERIGAVVSVLAIIGAVASSHQAAYRVGRSAERIEAAQIRAQEQYAALATQVSILQATITAGQREAADRDAKHDIMLERHEGRLDRHQSEIGDLKAWRERRDARGARALLTQGVPP